MYMYVKKIVSASSILNIARSFAEIDLLEPYAEDCNSRLIKNARSVVSNLKTAKLILSTVIEIIDSTRRLTQSDNMIHPNAELASAMISVHHAINEIRDSEALCDLIDDSEDPARIAMRIFLCKKRVVSNLKNASSLLEKGVTQEESSF